MSSIMTPRYSSSTRSRRLAGLWRRVGRPVEPVVLDRSDPRRYSREPRRLTPGNELELLIDGAQTFPKMLAAIHGAERYVHLETYILEGDEVGRAFADALVSRARAGVAVRLLFDSLGSLLLPPDFVQELVEAGVEVTEFRPLRRFWYRRRWSRRDHRKLLVVDGNVAFTGGLNISRDYGSPDPKSTGWRDTHVMVRGPVVSQAEALFRAMWHRGGGKPFPPLAPASNYDLETERPSLASIIASDGGRRSMIYHHYLHAVRTAETSILIANAYLVPDRRFIRALDAAVRRGVRVAVLVPEHSDVSLVQYATEGMFDRLLRSGVEIYQWPRTHMHAKTAVIDEAWSIVGSYNLDSISMFQNHEVVVEAVCGEFAKCMAAQFREDTKRSKRITLDDWSRRPWPRRAIEWLGNQCKRWL